MSELALPAKARVLDVGCGFGRHSIELARRGYWVVGVDPSVAMIAAAQERVAKSADYDFTRRLMSRFMRSMGNLLWQISPLTPRFA